MNKCYSPLRSGLDHNSTSIRWFVVSQWAFVVSKVENVDESKSHKKFTYVKWNSFLKISSLRDEKEEFGALISQKKFFLQNSFGFTFSHFFFFRNSLFHLELPFHIDGHIYWGKWTSPLNSAWKILLEQTIAVQVIFHKYSFVGLCSQREIPVIRLWHTCQYL